MTATTIVAHPTGPATPPGSMPSGRTTALRWALADTGAMVGRSVRHTTRAVDALILSVVLPVMLMLLFVYVFGGAIDTGSAYIEYVVPGIIILCAGYGAAETGVGVCSDLVNRIVDRFRTLPIVASSVLVGHVAASVARNLVSTVVVIGVAFALGFRPDAGVLQWLAAGGLIVLFVLAVSWVSVCFGLVARTPEAASGFAFFLLFLPYVSSAFVPTDTMPAAVQAVADHQPITPLIEAIRGLLTGSPIGSSAVVAIAWFASITVVAALGAGALFRRRTAR